MISREDVARHLVAACACVQPCLVLVRLRIILYCMVLRLPLDGQRYWTRRTRTILLNHMQVGSIRARDF